ncbi:hypothetical protein TSOC_001613 [Tetrabaena socialis]|uniref:GED domain-containing protein n=1 Tax=Tetrabaena socialis TaxID=47790 RepID=A0A2J8AG79_9CHLO|nr:hypothetical protein TSOC_001613 [Tetrabaena socialis]|eukprot:PNH11535.1 hypothetical protein TSOC_001613 [Tetrabaena socialis]
MEGQCFPHEFWALEEVVRVRQDYLGRELPTFLPYAAFEALVGRFKGSCKQRALECLDETTGIVLEAANELVALYLGRYPRAAAVGGVCPAHRGYGGCSIKAGYYTKVAAIEDSDIFTNDHFSFRQHHAEFLTRLKRASLGLDNSSSWDQAQVESQLTPLSKLLGRGVSVDKFALGVPTGVDDELQLMAACLAYIKVSIKRMVDNVPLFIRNELLNDVADKKAVPKRLSEHLETVEAQGLLDEDARVVRTRAKLESRIQRLKAAVKLLGNPQALPQALIAG